MPEPESTGCDSCGENRPPDGQSCPEPGVSPGPVSYGSGQLVHTETDLAAQGFGIPWGHTRSYANMLIGGDGSGSSLNGSRWYVSQLKALAFQFTGGAQPYRVVVTAGASSSQYFILSGGVYVNEFTGWNSLVWDADAAEFTLTQA